MGENERDRGWQRGEAEKGGGSGRQERGREGPTSSEPLGGAHGGQRSSTPFYRKEKQKTYTKGNARITSRRDQKAVSQDESSHVVEHREKDLIITPGGTEGKASEFSEDSLGNDE
ncbi:hypothetical protein Syun_025616 [Stephania yunnanensis]|uniref:Uncharacterized protein n=1 Tax=Stephania yunnanensis TaxID=152371 RepID=A0AAP0ES00_9MAGN